jgi:hypothetical protein
VIVEPAVAETVWVEGDKDGAALTIDTGINATAIAATAPMAMMRFFRTRRGFMCVAPLLETTF